MSEMVERVARALVQQNRGADLWDEIAQESDTDYIGKKEFMDLARAAIAAMWEPTTVMRLTGAITMAQLCGTKGSDETLQVWEAMIDAALK